MKLFSEQTRSEIDEQLLRFERAERADDEPEGAAAVRQVLDICYQLVGRTRPTTVRQFARRAQPQSIEQAEAQAMFDRCLNNEAPRQTTGQKAALAMMKKFAGG